MRRLETTGSKVVMSSCIWKNWMASVLRLGELCWCADILTAASPHSRDCCLHESILHFELNAFDRRPAHSSHPPTMILKVIKDDWILKGFPFLSFFLKNVLGFKPLILFSPILCMFCLSFYFGADRWANCHCAWPEQCSRQEVRVSTHATSILLKYCASAPELCKMLR